MRTISRVWIVYVLALVVGCGGDGDEGTPEPISVDGTAATGGADTVTERPADGPDERVSGQAVFSANCATCHGQDGSGNGPAAVGLEPPPSDLADATWTTGDGSLEAIVNTIENGSPGTAMIAWKGTLTQAQIDAVADYVHSLGGS